MSPQGRWLPDGRRLHLNHGPIDLVIEAFGDVTEVRDAYAQAVARFQTILAELVEELAELRLPASPAGPRRFLGTTAQQMEAAVLPHAGRFITPMAAVAGSVADEMMAALTASRRLKKAYINNGGDIALHIADGEALTVAIAGTGHGFSDRLTVRSSEPVRGIATSGWRGRSFSLGIADAVTVLAATAAQADAAATIIANAVDLPGHKAIERTPARLLQPDSDLGDWLVTTGIGRLSPGDVDEALAGGFAAAETLRRDGLIEAAALFLAGETRVTDGAEMLRSFAPPSVLPDISPARGEIGTFADTAPLSAYEISASGDDSPISPLAGEMSGRTEGGAVGHHAPRISLTRGLHG